MFTLRCATATGQPVDLRYDPRTSELLDADGDAVFEAQPPAVAHEAAFAVAPWAPARKVATPHTLKIQLGLGCNYRCSYCSQAGEVGSAAATSTRDAAAFLDGLDRWLERPPERIEFWGGEPLVYMAKLRVLVPELDRRFPDARFSMVSNGSLLDDEAIELIDRYDVDFSLSHDGPGQAHRGDDPFEDPRRLQAIRRLWALRKASRRMTFNVVLTPGNTDPRRIHAWFVERVGDPEVVVAFEGVVASYDEQTRDGVGRFDDTAFAELREQLARSLQDGDGFDNPTLRDKARDLVTSLTTRRPASTLGQKCGMDRDDQLAVDLHGNVLTCQNTGGTGPHRIGSVDRLADARLDTATHWSHRRSCTRCPVLQLCKGSCMYLHGDDFARSCDNEYHYNLGVFDGVLRRALGLRLLSVDADVAAPLPPQRGRRTIALRVAA